MATIKLRTRDKDSLARFLGWFSIGLGIAQVAAPRQLCTLVGADPDGLAPRVMRALGARERAQGTGILVRPRPTGWLWSRVAGDALDLSLLLLVAAKNRRARTLVAIANVVAVTVPDVYESRYLSRKNGPPERALRLRKAVTINRPRDEVEQAWATQHELREQVLSADAVVSFAPAPAGRGTELWVELTQDPPGGDLGRVLLKATGKDRATRLADDLRRFKQLVETGEIARSDATPDGHLLAGQLKQRPARPLEEAVR